MDINYAATNHKRSLWCTAFLPFVLVTLVLLAVVAGFVFLTFSICA